MGASFNVMMVSALTSLFFIVLFRIEQGRGARFGDGVRSTFDRMLVSIKDHIRDALPPINDHFLQELFYFSVHKTLSFLLGRIRKLERFVLRIVRFNRMQVVRLRTQSVVTTEQSIVASKVGEISSEAAQSPISDHLTQIAEHKKENALSPREKQKRKERSISGDGPF